MQRANHGLTGEETVSCGHLGSHATRTAWDPVTAVDPGHRAAILPTHVAAGGAEQAGLSSVRHTGATVARVVLVAQRLRPRRAPPSQVPPPRSVRSRVRSVFCKRGRRHKTGEKCTVHKDENCFLCDPTWAQDVCVQRSMSLSCLLYQAVM